MIERAQKLAAIRTAFHRAPIVSIVGLRQSGKTTLARQFAAQNGTAEFFDMEDPRSIARLQAPMTALSGLRGLVVIDEIQRLPELFPILRVLADRPDEPARFLILGSASPNLVRSVSESLAGRVALMELAGFDLAEISTDDFRQLWLRGGLPRSYLAADDALSLAWRRDFIALFLERDLPQLGITVPSVTLRRFWMMLAGFHGQIWNGAELARSIGASEQTARRYLDILSGAFAVRQLPAWFENIGKRTVKSPKVYLRDSGLLHALLEIGRWEQLETHPRLGASWEGFCIEQVLGVCGGTDCYFWATHAGAEVDLLLFRNGKRIGIEVKYADAPRTTKSMHVACADLKLDWLKVIYPGHESYELTERIAVMPLKKCLEWLAGGNP